MLNHSFREEIFPNTNIFTPYGLRCAITCPHPAAWAACFQASHSRPAL